MQNEAIFLEFSLKYDDGAPLKLGPGAKCPPYSPFLAPLIHTYSNYVQVITILNVPMQVLVD